MQQKIKKVVFLCVTVLMGMAVPVQAKEYYDTRLNNYENLATPYEGEIDSELASVCCEVDAGVAKVAKTADFDMDGKKEKVQLRVVTSKNGKRGTVTIRINGKKMPQITLKGESFCWEYVSFFTCQLNDRIIAVLLYGDNDYAGGGTVIYEWQNNDTLKKCRNYKAKGYLEVFTAFDRNLAAKVLYIRDSQQLFNAYGEKWPADVVKHYKKYVKKAKKGSISVTKSTYIKMNYPAGVLKNVEKDNYYRVSNAYD